MLLLLLLLPTLAHPALEHVLEVTYATTASRATRWYIDACG
jgi:hypothetical protein